MATSNGGAVIRPIDKAAVHRICSGQVVLDLATAVKELVENSLDAGANIIEIKLKDYGAESFEVADNGCGISPENYQALTLKYHTSKISEFADLQFLKSFGFRGEALSSLCALGNVSIVTRTKDEPVGAHLKFDHSGLLISQESEARPVGTTVIVSKLFSSLPVRHKEFNRNIRREYSRLLSVLHAYALIAKDVRVVCTHLTGKNKTIILKTQGTGSVKDNITTVFGTKTAASLEPLYICTADGCRVEGYISKPGSGCGRASGDRQFFYVNGRPVDIPKVSKLLNELYKLFNSQQYPMAVLDLILPTTAYDVNVTPDKRKVFLHAESALLKSLRDSLEEVYVPNKYTFAVHKLESSVLEKDSPLAREFPELETQEVGSDVNNDIDDLDAILTEGFEKADSPEEPLKKSGVEDQGELIEDGRDATDANKNEETAEQSKNNKFAFPCADLDSFQCSSGSTSIKISGNSANGERHLKFGGQIGKSNLSTVHQKVLQSKITGFISQMKRQPEDGSLISEEPLLKKWMYSACVDTGKDGLDSSSKSSIKPCTTPVRSHRLQVEDASLNFGSGDERLEADIKATACCPEQHEETGLCSTGNLLEEEETDASNCYCKDFHSSLQHTSLASSNDIQGSLKPILVEETASENGDGPCASEPESDAAVFAAMNKEDSTVQFNLERLKFRLKRGILRYEDSPSGSTRGATLKRRFFTAASMALDVLTKGESDKEEVLAAATRELERTFNKADFKRMKVIGQFNLGFILAKLDGDLFIIDQHASDEKYNFERLSKSTVLNRQPLIRPLPLELSAAEEVVVSIHIETFRQNGFDFIELKDAPPGQRLRLSAVPFSQNITFGVGDVQELVSILAEESAPECEGFEAFDTNSKQKKALTHNLLSVRPSRVRAMLASRACRSSIMIGDALSKKEMQRVLLHLADLDAPWNCPHGRPTMRHLADLSTVQQR